MTGLVDQLSKLIREQAIAAAAEKKRLEAVAAARAKAAAEARIAAEARARAQAAERERERIAQANRKPGRGKPEPAPPRIVEQAPVERPAPEEKPDPAAARAADIALAPAAADGAFAGLRGRMNAPITGHVAARFGAKRGDGPTWRGMFIKAARRHRRARRGGVAVIVFANWMRGYRQPDHRRTMAANTCPSTAITRPC